MSTVRAMVGAALAWVALIVLVEPPELGGAPPFLPPGATHLLGTDGQGQDVLGLLVHGAVSTLAVGLLAGLGMVALGASIALASAVWPRTRGLAELTTVVFLALPGLPLMVLLAAWMPPGPVTMAAVLVLTGWPWHARVLSASARVIAAQPWVEAARLAGEPAWRLALVEVAPSLAPLLLSSWLGASAYALGAEVGLEYVGLGDLDAVTWGTTLYWAANDAALIVGAWWVFIPVGSAVGLLSLALLELSRRVGLRLDPRLASLEAWRRLAPPPPACAADDPALVLGVRGLRVAFAGPQGLVDVVHGADLEVRAGEVWGVLGPSGSGKSAWLAAALGLLPPPGVVRAGEVIVVGRGVPAGQPLPRALYGRAVAWVPQAAQAALHPAHTVADALRETLRAHDLPDADAFLLDALARVRLGPEVLDRTPGQLSGGMRQRVVIAAALICGPALLVLDEPTTALDPDVAAQILDDLREAQRALGFAMVVISHDAALIRRYADRVVSMRDGRIVPTSAPAPRAPVAAAQRPPGEVLASMRGVSGPRGAALVRDVDLSLRAGEVTALIGPSGGGKTTVARLLAGLADVAAGEVVRPARVAFVHQDPFVALHPTLPSRHGVERAILRSAQPTARWQALFAAVQLDPGVGERPPAGLSGGQRQRVAVARAMASLPDLWIADEPTAMLDAALREALLQLLITAVRDRGGAMLLITHDLGAVLGLVDRIAVVDGGRVIEQGTVSALLGSPTHPTTRRLLRGVE